MGLDVLEDLGVAEIVFTGGNPLLRRDMGEILRYAHDLFPLVSIYDNGSLAWRRIKELKYADVVCVSVNSLDSKVNDWLCGVSGALDASLKSIRALKSEKINVVAAITISEANIDEASKMIEFFGLKDIPIVLSLYSDVAYSESLIKIGYHDNNVAFKNREKLLNFFREIRRLKKLYPIHLDPKTLRALEENARFGVRGWKCKALSSFFVVDEFGRVSGCHVKPAVASLKNLREQWRSKFFEELRSKYASCEECLYLCYVAYSLLDGLDDLFAYGFDYGQHRLESFMRRIFKL
jgi:MoaA/NifB/PqqE/SkfB family radical SAM enzyme